MTVMGGHDKEPKSWSHISLSLFELGGLQSLNTSLLPAINLDLKRYSKQFSINQTLKGTYRNNGSCYQDATHKSHWKMFTDNMGAWTVGGLKEMNVLVM